MHWHIHQSAPNTTRASQGRMQVAVAIDRRLYAARSPAARHRRAALRRFPSRRSGRPGGPHRQSPGAGALGFRVLEGYVETRLKGHSATRARYYSLADDYPVLHVTAITHRRDPIYSTTIVGQAPMEDPLWARPPSVSSYPL